MHYIRRGEVVAKRFNCEHGLTKQAGMIDTEARARAAQRTQVMDGGQR